MGYGQEMNTFNKLNKAKIHIEVSIRVYTKMLKKHRNHLLIEEQDNNEYEYHHLNMRLYELFIDELQELYKKITGSLYDPEVEA